MFVLPMCDFPDGETDCLLVVSILYDSIVDGRRVDIVVSILVAVPSDVCNDWFEGMLVVLAVLRSVIKYDG